MKNRNVHKKSFNILTEKSLNLLHILRSRSGQYSHIWLFLSCTSQQSQAHLGEGQGHQDLVHFKVKLMTPEHPTNRVKAY